MNATDPLHAVAEAAEGVRDRLAAAEIGRHLGHACSTITRRGDLPVVRWPFAEVLTLARQDERLGSAVVALLTRAPQRPRGSSTDLPAAVCAELVQAAELAAAWVSANADGVIRRAEYRDVLARAERLRDAADSLINNARAGLMEARL